jgi:hypothetical protein
MADEPDGGVQKQEILRQIAGAALPYRSAPRDLGGETEIIVAEDTVVLPVPAPAPATARPILRERLAGLVLLAAGAGWYVVAAHQKSWLPCEISAVLLVLGSLVLIRSLLR